MQTQQLSTASTGRTTRDETAARVVLAVTDPAVASEIGRLAAGAGCPLVPGTDLDGLRREWHRGPAVLLGADLLPAIHQAGLPRRPDLHVVSGSALSEQELRLSLSLGASGVLELPADRERVAALLGDLADAGSVHGRVVGVVGASGGVGASVLTVALATVAEEHDRALAVDLDPGGPGLEVLAGLGPGRTPGWGALAPARGRLNGGALRAALATEDGPAVLGWGTGGDRDGPGTPLVGAALSAARRGHDWTFVDSRSPEVWSGCDALALVVAGSVPGVTAAVRVVDQLPPGLPAGVVVRSSRHDRWSEQVPRSLGLPLWGVMTHQRSLDEHLSAGLGPVSRRRGPLRRAARHVLGELARR